MKVACIAILGSARQNECFWPTYNSNQSGIDHDLIVVHRNMLGVPEFCKAQSGHLILENKSNISNGKELEHRAFGAYRHFGIKYCNKYDYLAFISDDVLFQTQGWLLEAVQMLSKYDKLGFVGTQIFNAMNSEYPHETHCRAPIWFAKTEAIKKLDWNFDSDHEGEMNLCQTFLKAGYFGAQVGNKIDVAYDALENGGYYVGDHISSILSKHLKFKPSDREQINANLMQKLINNDDSDYVISPHQHIGRRNVISQLQPFNALVVDTGIELAGNSAKNINYGIHILKDYI